LRVVGLNGALCNGAWLLAPMARKLIPGFGPDSSGPEGGGEGLCDPFRFGLVGHGA